MSGKLSDEELIHRLRTGAQAADIEQAAARIEQLARWALLDDDDRRARELIRGAARLMESAPDRYGLKFVKALIAAREVVLDGRSDWEDFEADKAELEEPTDYNGFHVSVQHWAIAALVEALDAPSPRAALLTDTQQGAET